MRYSRYNTENVSNNIKIISQEKETMCAPHCVSVLFLKACLHAENHILHLNFTSDSEISLIFLKGKSFSTL